MTGGRGRLIMGLRRYQEKGIYSLQSPSHTHGIAVGTDLTYLRAGEAGGAGGITHDQPLGNTHFCQPGGDTASELACDPVMLTWPDLLFFYSHRRQGGFLGFKGLPSGDMQILAGDKVGQIRGKEQGRSSDILRRSHSLQWDAFTDDFKEGFLIFYSLSKRRPERSADGPRNNGIDTDIIFRQVISQIDSQAQDAGLGRVVVNDSVEVK